MRVATLTVSVLSLYGLAQGEAADDYDVDPQNKARVINTNNDCLAEEGATKLGKCFDWYYKYCDTYEIEPLAACNVTTYGRASVSWLTSSITMGYWRMIKDLPGYIEW